MTFSYKISILKQFKALNLNKSKKDKIKFYKITNKDQLKLVIVK